MWMMKSDTNWTYSIHPFTSVTSLIRGILDKDSVTKCQPNKLLSKIIEGLNTKNNKQLDQLSFAKDHTK